MAPPAPATSAEFEGRGSLRAWLYRLATNVCLDLIAPRKRRLLPEEYAPKADPHQPPGEPVAEQVWIEPYPDQALEIPDGSASPGATYEERESLELAFVAAMQCARETVDKRLPDRSQQVTLRSLGDARMKEIVEEYMEAMRSGRGLPPHQAALGGSGSGATARPSPTASSRWVLTPGSSRRKLTFRSLSTCLPWTVIGSRK